MKYTVKQLADLSGITRRTLHYYDEIGLLKPSSYGGNGYRYYDNRSIYRLQQILFFREMEMSLEDIGEILDQPGFDIAASLASHRIALQKKTSRLTNLIHTIEKTILYMNGEIEMSNEEIFEGFDEKKQAEYEKEAAERWDPELVKESSHRWKSYTKEKQAAIRKEGRDISAALAGQLEKDASDEAVQELVGQWHQNLRNFYEPTNEILEGLGELYATDPAFSAVYAKVHPDLPEFFRDAIRVYVEKLRVAS